MFNNLKLNWLTKNSYLHYFNYFKKAYCNACMLNACLVLSSTFSGLIFLNFKERKMLYNQKDFSKLKNHVFNVNILENKLWNISFQAFSRTFRFRPLFFFSRKVWTYLTPKTFHNNRLRLWVPESFIFVHLCNLLNHIKWII